MSARTWSGPPRYPCPPSAWPSAMTDHFPRGMSSMPRRRRGQFGPRGSDSSISSSRRQRIDLRANVGAGASAWLGFSCWWRPDQLRHLFQPAPGSHAAAWPMDCGKQVAPRALSTCRDSSSRMAGMPSRASGRRALDQAFASPTTFTGAEFVAPASACDLPFVHLDSLARACGSNSRRHRTARRPRGRLRRSSSPLRAARRSSASFLDGS